MKPKTTKILYWVVTILFAAFMVFSGISEIMNGQAQQDLMKALGYPLYLNMILGVAKLLGVIVLLTPNLRTLKEWAYAGFTIDLIGAGVSFAFVSAPLFGVLFPLIPLAVMFVSYGLWKKVRTK